MILTDPNDTETPKTLWKQNMKKKKHGLGNSKAMDNTKTGRSPSRLAWCLTRGTLSWQGPEAQPHRLQMSDLQGAPLVNRVLCAILIYFMYLSVLLRPGFLSICKYGSHSWVGGNINDIIYHHLNSNFKPMYVRACGLLPAHVWNYVTFAFSAETGQPDCCWQACVFRPLHYLSTLGSRVHRGRPKLVASVQSIRYYKYH